MLKNNLTGSVSVDSMLTLNIQGNMIPFAWYQTILRENGKPYLLAIIILSDLVYWFKPVETRDEITGTFLGWKKRFKADLLQKSYQNYVDLLGESKRSVKAAMDALEALGVIRREFRSVQTAGTVVNNVMFVDLDVEVLKKLTYPEYGDELMLKRNGETTSEKANSATYEDNVIIVPEEIKSHGAKENGKPVDIGYANAITPPTKFCRRVVQNSAGGSYKILQESPAKFCGTNTENTTEITTEKEPSIDLVGKRRLRVTADKHDLAIDHTLPDTMDGSEGTNAIRNGNPYEELIRENIGYDSLIQTEDISLREIYGEMFLLVCDVVCHERKTVRIGGKDLPYEAVKSRFLKLEMKHLQYAAHMIRTATSEIRNMRAYMLTTLYRAPETAVTFWTQKAAHDIHTGIWQNE